MLRKKEKALKPRKRKEEAFKKSSFLKVFLIGLFLFIFFHIQVLAEEESSVLSEALTATLQVEKIEKNIFKQSFKGESLEERVSRIENFLFGDSYPIESINSRIEKIISSLEKRESLKKPEEDEKAEVIIQKKDESNPLNSSSSSGKPNTVSNMASTYVIDPLSGNLINQQTGEVLRDNFGYPLSIKRQGLPPTWSPENSLPGVNFPNIPKNPLENIYGNQNNPYNDLLKNGSKQNLPPELLLQLQDFNSGQNNYQDDLDY